MLNVKDVHVNYGPISALKGISLEIKSGHITAIIGANGSGKSTLLNAISGLVDVNSGEIIFENNPIHNIAVEERVKLGIAHVLEGRRLFKDQTVHDNLLIGLHFRENSRSKGIKNGLERINEVYKRFPILQEKRNQLAGTLSGGQQQLLIISMALLSNPKLLILDEPSLGLAPIIVDQVYQYLEELKNDGVTIVVSEQLAALALRIADYGYVLEHGKMIKSGDNNYLKTLLESDELSTVYLGKVDD